jgi:hypothetical protein
MISIGKTKEAKVKELEIILDIAKFYSMIWDDPKIIPNREFEFYNVFISYDETLSVFLVKEDGEMHLRTRNTMYDSRKNLTPEEVVYGIENTVKNNPGNFRQKFEESFKKPLGIYLAEREMKKW